MLPIPKYKELGVRPMWGFIKDVPDLVEFFPNLKQNELPDRAFMWGILGTKRREA